VTVQRLSESSDSVRTASVAPVHVDAFDSATSVNAGVGLPSSAGWFTMSPYACEPVSSVSRTGASYCAWTASSVPSPPVARAPLRSAMLPPAASSAPYRSLTSEPPSTFSAPP
jgi:hypothetical protein